MKSSLYRYTRETQGFVVDRRRGDKGSNGAGMTPLDVASWQQGLCLGLAAQHNPGPLPSATAPSSPTAIMGAFGDLQPGGVGSPTSVRMGGSQCTHISQSRGCGQGVHMPR